MTSNREVCSEMLFEGDKSNLLILFSSDRAIPMNPVCLDVLQDVLLNSVRLKFWPVGLCRNL